MKRDARVRPLKLDFARVVEILSGLPLLLLSLATILLTLVDRFSIFGLSVYPELPSGATQQDKLTYGLLKFIILFISLISAAIAADRLSHFTKVERELSRLSASYEAIASGQAILTTPLKDRAAFYRALLQAISSAPHGAKLCIDAYEKLKMPYESGEDTGERALMKLYDQRVRANEIHVEQLTHVSTLQDLEDAWKRAKSYEKCPNFTLSVVVGVAPDPLVEFMTVGEDIAIMGISTQAASPYAVDGGHLSRSADIVQLYRQQHRLWTSRFGRPLKTRDSLATENYEALKRLLPSGHALDLPVDLSLFALRSYRNTSLFMVLNRFVEGQEKVDGTGHEMSTERLSLLLGDTAAKVEEIAAGRLVFSGDGFRYVHRLLLGAKSTVCAVAPKDSLDFWRSQAGISLQKDVQGAVQRGVAVTRVFVLPLGAKDTPDIEALLRGQARDGLTVLVLENDGSLDYLERDFLLVDDRVAFEDQIGASRGESRLIVRDELMKEYREAWQLITQFAEPFEA